MYNILYNVRSLHKICFAFILTPTWLQMKRFWEHETQTHYLRPDSIKTAKLDQLTVFHCEEISATAATYKNMGDLSTHALHIISFDCEKIKPEPLKLEDCCSCSIESVELMTKHNWYIIGHGSDNAQPYLESTVTIAMEIAGCNR
jgi:hypothetical protein